MLTDNNAELSRELGRVTLDMVGELTPITVKEAKNVLGKSSDYKSDEEFASAILDFTAIARSFIRTVPKSDI